MNRSLGKASANSMELLLDTVCNMFGSIILITLLIVIVTSEQPIDQILDMNQGPDREEIDRRLETARLQIESLQSEIQKERAKAPAASADEKHATDLQAKVQAAEAALQSALRDQQTAFDRTSPEFAKTLREFKTRLESLAQEITDLENQLADSQRRRPALQAEFASLQAAHKGLTSGQVEKFRLPKARSTTKKPLNVICAHGAIYPVISISPTGDLSRFEGIRFNSLDSRRTEYIPIRGAGIPPETTAIRREFAHLPADHYLSVFIYPNSIEAFRALRKAFPGNTMDIGWDPLTPDERLIFVTGGGGLPAPPPQ
jgi:uncharacterized protein YlxW (UPF0749 family)